MVVRMAWLVTCSGKPIVREAKTISETRIRTSNSQRPTLNAERKREEGEYKIRPYKIKEREPRKKDQEHEVIAKEEYWGRKKEIFFFVSLRDLCGLRWLQASGYGKNRAGTLNLQHALLKPFSSFSKHFEPPRRQDRQKEKCH
jgi:hypothetical protein